MSLFISKLVGALLAPVMLMLMALLLAFIGFRRFPRFARALVGLVALALLALQITPLDHWVVDPLQHRFPHAVDLKLDRVDGIIALGGAITNTDIPMSGLASLESPGERATAFFVLARRYPQAKLVFSGGGGPYPEADSARQLFEAMGLPPERVIYERESRTTWENALLSLQLAKPQPGERWLLLTSAWHMPRAVGIFRKLGWPVIAWPVDYLGYDDPAWFGFDAPRRLVTLNYAVKEWIGLFGYHLMGRTDAWFPESQRTDYRVAPDAPHTAPAAQFENPA